jgi:hypothetical protein
MANYLLIRHKVRNFKSWKRGYDAHRPSRVAAGLAQKSLLRSVSDPNEVVVLFAAKDLRKARAFVASDDLREAMQRVGVVDVPNIYFLKG